jgi:hypothetical protein
MSDSIRYSNDKLEYLKDKMIYHINKIGIDNVDDDLLLDLIVELDLDKLIEEIT